MIQIKLDENIKKSLIRRHWLWFWIRLNNTNIRLNSGELTLYKFFNSKLHWTKKDFKNLVLGEYHNLLSFIETNNNYYVDFANVAKDPVIRQKESTFEKVMLDCLGYKDFRSGKVLKNVYPKSKHMQDVINWSAFELVKELKLEVCPYCNKEYIPIVKNNGKFRAEIDHFFPEADYPYLSCSLFNLIPSCLICNHHKGDSYNVYKDGNIKLTIYPYTEGFEMSDNTGEIRNIAVFKAVPGPRGVYESKSVELKHEIQPSNDEERLLDDKITKSNDAFLIEELYNTCQTELEDLLTRHRNYAYPKIQNIMDMLSKDVQDKLSNLDIPKEQKEDLLKEISLSFNKSMRDQILGVPLDSAGKEVNKEYPFRKFKKDIIKQLDDWVDQKKRGTI